MKIVSSLPPLDDAKPPAAKAKPEGYTQAELDAAHIYFAEDAPAEA